MTAGPPGTIIGRLRIKVLPDTTDFRSELQRDLERIEQQVGDFEIDVVADLDAGSFAAAARFAEAIVDAEVGGAIRVPVEPDVDRSAFAGAGRGGAGGARAPGRRTEFDLPDIDLFDRSLRRINDQADRLFRTLGGPSARGASIVGAIAAIASLVSPLVGAFQLLPGLAAVALGPIGAIALGFEGAQRAVGGLNEQIFNIPRRVSGPLNIATENVVESINRASGTISDGFANIAIALVPVSTAIAEVIDEANRSGQLRDIFDAVADAVREIGRSGVIQELGQFLLDSTQGSLEALPGFFEAVRDAINDEDFRRNLDRIIEALPQALEDLNSFVRFGLPVVLEFLAATVELSQDIIRAARGVRDLFVAIEAISIEDTFIQAGTELLGFQALVDGTRERIGQIQGAIGFLRDAAGEFGISWSTVFGNVAIDTEAWRSGTERAFSGALGAVQTFQRLGQQALGFVQDELIQFLVPTRAARDGLTNLRDVGSAALRALGSAAGEFGRRAEITFANVRSAIGFVADQARDLGRAFSSGVQTAIRAVASLPGRIRSILGGISLRDIGANIIDSLVAGLEAGFARVQSVLGRLTSLIPDWKGPLDEDRRLLREPADAIVDGFIGRLESRFGDIRRAFGSFPIDVEAEGGGAAGLTQVFQVDPRTDEDYVERVSSRARREGDRLLNLQLRRV